MKNLLYIPSIDEHSLNSVVEKAIVNNFGIELFDFVNPLILNNGLSEYTFRLKKLLSGKYVELSAHAPFYDLNAISIDSDIVDITLKKYNDFLNSILELDVKKVIFHTPFDCTAKLEFYKNYFIEKYSEFWEKYVKIFEENEIVALLENTHEQTPDIIKNVITNVNSKNLKTCIDIGHININSDVSVYEWIKAMGKDLCYMHLHNNDGIYDLHTSVKNGTLDFQKIYKLILDLGLNPDMSFEIFDEKKLEESIKFVSDMVFTKSF